MILLSLKFVEIKISNEVVYLSVHLFRRTPDYFPRIETAVSAKTGYLRNLGHAPQIVLCRTSDLMYQTLG